MYLGMKKLGFSPDDHANQDLKAAKALCQSIKARFKVIACVCSSMEHDGVTSIAFASFGKHEQELANFLDQISAFCESSGFGRIEESQSIVESIMSLDFEDDDES
jgi:hypothetical protein